MLRFFLWLFAIIGLIAVLLTGMGVYVGVHAFRNHGHKTEVAQSVVLRLDLEKAVTENSDKGGLASLIADNDQTPFPKLVDAIYRGANDPRVYGLVARTGSIKLGFAQVQELRDAVKAFRAKGKFAYAYGDSFGSLGGGTRAYYLASVFDQIWLQPVGGLGLTGAAAELPFLKGTLDKLGVTADFDRRGDYKTAETELSQTKLPDTDRAALTDMLTNLYEQEIAGIAEARKLKPEEVKAILDNGPYLAKEALDKKLVDKIGYIDEVETAALTKTHDEAAEFISAVDYDDAAQKGQPSGSVVAVIRAVGTISSGDSDAAGFGGGDGVGSLTMVKALDDARKSDAVKAIVLRIDSPGGSDVASESIWHAVKRARDAGKPVIVSMGDTAASGGYFIAAGANKIVAEPGTLTGSIGVFGGKPVLAGLWDKLGVTWDSVTVGQNGDISSTNKPFTPAQREKFEAMLDASYQNFVGHVAEGRHLSAEQALALAGGRVWTGAQAKANGLVDELGGFSTALRLAREEAKLAPDAPVTLRVFPRPKSPFEQIYNGLTGNEGGGSSGLPSYMAGAATAERLRIFAPLLQGLATADQPAAGNATMRPVELRP